MKDEEKEKENRLSKEEEEELRRLEEKYRVLIYKVGPIVFIVFFVIAFLVFSWFIFVEAFFPTIFFVIFTIGFVAMSLLIGYSTLIQMRLSELYSKRGDFTGLVGGIPFFLRRKKKKEFTTP